jgi:hypothetical protein
VRRLEAALGNSVPDGNTVVVTITAPIRQSFKTETVLMDRIRILLASRKARLAATIHGNRVRVRILKGGARRTAKLIGFVHNLSPDPALLFEVTRRLLACVSSSTRHPKGDRVLLIANASGRAPVDTIRQAYTALRLRTVFKRALVMELDSVRAL